MIGGSFLPWAYREDLFAGVDGSYFPGIWIVRVLAGLVAVSLVLRRFTRQLALAGGLSGLAVGALALLMIGKENGEEVMTNGLDGPVFSGFGLWGYLVGAGLLLIGGLIGGRVGDSRPVELLPLDR